METENPNRSTALICCFTFYLPKHGILALVTGPQLIVPINQGPLVEDSLYLAALGRCHTWTDRSKTLPIDLGTPP